MTWAGYVLMTQLQLFLKIFFELRELLAKKKSAGEAGRLRRSRESGMLPIRKQNDYSYYSYWDGLCRDFNANTGTRERCFLTFGSLDQLQITAPGQITAADLSDVCRIHNINKQTQTYGIIGSGFADLVSSQVHNAAFAALCINAAYLPPDDNDNFVFNKKVCFKINPTGPSTNPSAIALLSGARTIFSVLPLIMENSIFGWRDKNSMDKPWQDILSNRRRSSNG